jgi:transposase
MQASKNRYYKHSRISEAKFRQILRCFALDLTATETAQLTGISVRSINSVYLKIRKRITETCQQQSPFPSDNESTGSDLGSNTDDPVSQYLAFGIFRQQDCIFTEIASPCIRKYLQQSHRRCPNMAELIQAEGWKAYDGLVDVNKAKLYHLENNDKDSASPGLTTNNVDTFWAYAKRRLVQFNGIHRHTFYLHLKESEFRFNYRRDNLYRVFLKLLRANPL